VKNAGRVGNSRASSSFNSVAMSISSKTDNSKKQTLILRADCGFFVKKVHADFYGSFFQRECFYRFKNVFCFKSHVLNKVFRVFRSIKYSGRSFIKIDRAFVFTITTHASMYEVCLKIEKHKTNYTCENCKSYITYEGQVVRVFCFCIRISNVEGKNDYERVCNVF